MHPQRNRYGLIYVDFNRLTATLNYPLKHKKLLHFALLLPVLGALVVFIGVNVADYCRYRYIMNLDKHLTAADFEALVQATKTANIEEREYRRYSDSNIPAAFKKLGAKTASFLQADAIGGGIDMIPKQLHGKMIVDKNVMDGLQMEIRFSKDGSPSEDDIMLSNAWSTELEPLLNMLKEFAPHAEEIPTKKRMIIPTHRYDESDTKYVGDYQIEPIEKWRAYPPLQTDWWIVWPKFFLEKPKVVLEVPPEWKKP